MNPLRSFFKKKAPPADQLFGIDTYELLSNSLPFGVTLIDPEMNVLRSNAKMREWFPQLNESSPEKCYCAFNNPPRKSRCPECVRHQNIENKNSATFIRQVRTAKGFRTLKLKSVPLVDAQGVSHGFLEIAEDVTEQKAVERSISHHLEFMELVTRISASMANVADENWDSNLHNIMRQLGQFFAVDRCCLFSLDPETITLSNTHEWCAEGISAQIEFLQDIPESALPWWISQIRNLHLIHYPDIHTLPPEAALEKEELIRQETKSILYLPMEDDRHRCVGCLGFDAVRIPHTWSDEQISMLKVFTSVLTGALLRKQNLQTLVRSELQYRQLVENSLNGVLSLELLCDIDGSPLDLQITSANPSACKILDRTPEELRAKNVSEILPDLVRPDFLKLCSRVVRTRQGGELALQTADGQRHLSLSAYPLQGLRLAVILIDNTEHVNAMESLRSKTDEHAALEAQFHQAMKMESIGRLAGGVAHDFNNTLQVILGNAEMALNFQNPSDTLKNTLLEIRDAAKRSSALTRQLLAFARKQSIEPRELYLNLALQELMKMLKRLISEDIRLETSFDPKLWPVFIDPGQLDQILANLCVNASDAIDSEGLIRIELSNHTASADDLPPLAQAGPGDYVRLSVHDNGSGIDPELQSKIFEPFITTKPEGKGTGLGLATVHGIVLQNKGFITLDSTPGHGTSFHIFLPRHLTPASTAQPLKPIQDLQKGTEHILIVEDEPMILQMTELTLAKLGYQTHSARSPAEALDLAENPTVPMDMILTDVVMPGMDGKELAQRIQTLRPGTRVLYMSGYTNETMSKYGISASGCAFIQKPFSVTAISQKLRDVLDAAPK